MSGPARAHGLDHAAALPYLWLVMALTAAACLPLVARRHGSATLAAALRPATVAAGALFFGAYLLVLEALRLAPPGPVAAVRETSVVIATALGYVILRRAGHARPRGRRRRRRGRHRARRALLTQLSRESRKK